MRASLRPAAALLPRTSSAGPRWPIPPSSPSTVFPINTWHQLSLPLVGENSNCRRKLQLQEKEEKSILPPGLSLTLPLQLAFMCTTSNLCIQHHLFKRLNSKEKRQISRRPYSPIISPSSAPPPRQIGDRLSLSLAPYHPDSPSEYSMQDGGLFMMSPMTAAGEAAAPGARVHPQDVRTRRRRSPHQARAGDARGPPTPAKTPRTKMRQRIAQASQLSAEQLFFQEFGSCDELINTEFDLARPVGHPVPKTRRFGSSDAAAASTLPAQQQHQHQQQTTGAPPATSASTRPRRPSPARCLHLPLLR